MSIELDRLLGDKNPFDMFEFTDQIVKLTTGESIVAGVARYDGDNYILCQPLRVIIVPGQETSSIAMTKFLIGSTDVFFVLKAKNVLAMGYPDSVVMDFYEEALDRIKVEENDMSELLVEDDNIISFPSNTKH